MVDQKEFFAEMSVSFFSNGYHKLSKADKTIMESCSPPLLQPDVFVRVLRNYGIKDPLERPEESICSFLLYSRRQPKPKLGHVDPIFQERAISTGCRAIVHCNKFYPFTRGQLKHNDPDLFRAMQELWREIACWEDPEAGTRTRCAFPLFPDFFQ
jgi:hypothetical protein